MSGNNIGGLQIYHSFLRGYNNMVEHREYMNRINVFPVADGDTGNNMLQTLKGIVSGVKPQRSASAVLEAMADLALQGSRGNSGIIISQYINGLSSKVTQDSLALEDFSNLLKEAVNDAYEAMETPQEGTILTVLKSWAHGLYSASKKSNPVSQAFSSALNSAKEALSKTPEQLKVLKDNGVVDAGAWGLVCFLKGIDAMGRHGLLPLSYRKQLDFSKELPPAESLAHMHDPVPTKRYCTEVLLENCLVDTPYLKDLLRPLGDSLVVSQGKRRTRIHIHSNDPSEIVRALQPLGSLVEQKADDMIRQRQTSHHRLSDVAVITDSIADIPLDIQDKYQIHMLPIRLLWDDEEYLDRITITPGEFYRLQAERTSFPGSSVPEAARVEL
jgi:dihydroxyacetone kinase-like predicted kinase